MKKLILTLLIAFAKVIVQGAPNTGLKKFSTLISLFKIIFLILSLHLQPMPEAALRFIISLPNSAAAKAHFIFIRGDRRRLCR